LSRRRRYRVELAPAPARQLRRLPPGDASRGRAAILALAIAPRPPGVARVTGSEYWRIRVGELRVIYLVDDDAAMVVILKVARRGESTYRRVG